MNIISIWFKLIILLSFAFVLALDSTVLAYVLKLLNEKYDYGLDLVLLSVDEGITGYRDDSLEVRIIPVAVMEESKFTCDL